MPANPSPSTIRRDWMDMIENGVLLIGEPCSPYMVTRYISKNGNITRESVDIYLGEKGFPKRSKTNATEKARAVHAPTNMQ